MGAIGKEPDRCDGQALQEDSAVRCFVAGDLAVLLEEVIGQFRVKDRTTAHLAQFHDYYRRVMAGELDVSRAMTEEMIELHKQNSRLVHFRLATADECAQLGSTEPVLMMDPSRELLDILARVRHTLATRERRPPKETPRYFVR